MAKLALNLESAAALRELSKSIAKINKEMLDETEEMQSYAVQHMDRIGVHAPDFEALFTDARKAVKIITESINDGLCDRLNKVATQIEIYVQSKYTTGASALSSQQNVINADARASKEASLNEGVSRSTNGRDMSKAVESKFFHQYDSAQDINSYSSKDGLHHFKFGGADFVLNDGKGESENTYFFNTSTVKDFMKFFNNDGVEIKTIAKNYNGMANIPAREINARFATQSALEGDNPNAIWKNESEVLLAPSKYSANYVDNAFSNKENQILNVDIVRCGVSQFYCLHSNEGKSDLLYFASNNKNVDVNIIDIYEMRIKR